MTKYIIHYCNDRTIQARNLSLQRYVFYKVPFERNNDIPEALQVWLDGCVDLECPSQHFSNYNKTLAIYPYRGMTLQSCFCKWQF